MKVVALKKADQNEAAIDPWTFVHTAMGLAAGLVELPFWPAMIAAVAYEVVEHYMESGRAGFNPFGTKKPERLANVVVDIGVFAIGYKLAEAWNES